MDLSHIATCSDMTEDDFVLASASRESAYELLNHASVICEPHSGEERLLLFLARCALQDWVDGDLRVEVRLEGMFECHLLLLCGLGGDAFEVMKRVFLSASFLSFKQLGEQPGRLMPLRATTIDNRHIVLDATAAVRQQSVPPPDFVEAQRRLERKLAPPQVEIGEMVEVGDIETSVESPQVAPPRSSSFPEELPLVVAAGSVDGPPSARAVARIALSKKRLRSVPDITEVVLETDTGEDGCYTTRREMVQPKPVTVPTEPAPPPAPEPEPSAEAADELEVALDDDW